MSLLCHSCVTLVSLLCHSGIAVVLLVIHMCLRPCRDPDGRSGEVSIQSVFRCIHSPLCLVSCIPNVDYMEVSHHVVGVPTTQPVYVADHTVLKYTCV